MFKSIKASIWDGPYALNLKQRAQSANMEIHGMYRVLVNMTPQT